MKRNRSLTIILSVLLIGSSASAQDRSYLSLIASVKGHKFYDPGVYQIGSTNNAKTKGLGLYLQYDISRNISLTGGYGFASIDSLKYDNGTTNNAKFHQWDLNIGYHFLDYYAVVRPYLFFGYSHNTIPQLASFNEFTTGMNSNFGAGLRYRINDGISLDANSTYAFSYSSQIRFNFRHQIGVVLTPKALLKDRPGGPAPTNDTRYNLLLSDNHDMAQDNDSLQAEIDYLNNKLSNKESSGLLVAYNNDLNKKIRFLEEENQRLLNELRFRRFTLDSALKAEHGLFQIIDSAGEKQEVSLQQFKPGYYLIKAGFNNQRDAEAVLADAPFNMLSPIYLMTDLEEFHAIGWLSEDESKANELLRAYNKGGRIYTMKKL